MNAMEIKETVRRFIELINAHYVDGLYNLMIEDHKFVDALGEVVQGGIQCVAHGECIFGWCLITTSLVMK